MNFVQSGVKARHGFIAGRGGITFSAAQSDVFVDRHGKVSIIDFNWATVNSSYSCAPGHSQSLPTTFAPQPDGDLALLVELLAAVNRSHRDGPVLNTGHRVPQWEPTGHSLAESNKELDEVGTIDHDASEMYPAAAPLHGSPQAAARRRYGRTAVMLTGEPRSLNVPFWTQTQFEEQLNSKLAIQFMARAPETWAGLRRGRWGSNTMATAMHNNLFAPLAQYGGYDLFCLQQGPAKLANGSIVPGHTPGEFDILKPDTLDAYGRPNGFFTRVSNSSGDIPYRFSDVRWRNFFFTAAHKKHPEPQIHNMLILNQFLYEINDWVNEHAATTGMVYRYKMRLRPDSAVLLPIPPPHTLDEELERRVVFIPDSRYMSNNRDKFALGLAEHMDLYGAKYPLLHANAGDAVDLRFGHLRMETGLGCGAGSGAAGQKDPPAGCGMYAFPRLWTTEMFLESTLLDVGNITMESDPRFRIVIIRPAHFSRNVGPRTTAPG